MDQTVYSAKHKTWYLKIKSFFFTSSLLEFSIYLPECESGPYICLKKTIGIQEYSFATHKNIVID